jgi:hypothetical protein
MLAYAIMLLLHLFHRLACLLTSGCFPEEPDGEWRRHTLGAPLCGGREDFIQR